MKLGIIIAVLSFLVLSISLFPLIVADLDSDKQALLEFISSVPHGRKLNWDFSSPVCTSWVGITCDPSQSHVISVRLPAIGLYGLIPNNTLGRLDSLKILSLRSNYFNGSIPSDVASIPSLQILYLQHNNFTGSIPDSLPSQLKVLDLSFNSFSGSIPPKLQNLTKLKLLNLSYNKLTGSIPYSLQKFPDSSFLGNSLVRNEPMMPLNHKKRSAKKLSTGTVVALVVGGFMVLFLIIFVVVICCIKKKDGAGVISKTKKAINGGNETTSKDFGSGVQEPEKNKLFFFEGCTYNFDLEDLLRASAEVLGKGSYGTAYKAILDDGTTLVVKRLREVISGKREFEQQMELVGKAGRHPNVVPVRAYYYSKDEKLLVYEYMPEGSLFSWLHGSKNLGRTPLDWDSRVKVALGAAKAIAYLHSDIGAKSLHGNIKSTNVFLNRDHDGCISDIGLTPLMNFSAVISRTIGYHPPEVIETRKVTYKSDVYSFGVLLLEMLTGKAPLQYPGYENAVDLPRWVRSVVREEWTAEVFDVELLRFQHSEEEMVQMLQIALACVAKVPDARPGMDEVVRMIEEILEGDIKERPSSGTESNVQTP